MRKVFVQVILLLIVAFGLSACLYGVYLRQHNLRYVWPRNIFVLPQIQEKYELVKLGNSHAQEAITFERYNLKSLDLSSVAQTFEYDLANLKMYANQIKPGALVIINISPVSFSQRKSGREDAFQTKYYDGHLSPFLIPNLKVEDYLQSQIFPFLRAGFLLRSSYEQLVRDKFDDAQRDPALNQEKPPKQPTLNLVKKSQITPTKPTKKLNVRLENYYFNVEAIEKELASPSAVPTDVLEVSADGMKNKWYGSDGFGLEYFETNRRDLQKIIDYCVQKNWQPLLVSLPISQVLVEILQPDYMQVYVYDNLKEINLHGAPIYDFAADERIKINRSIYSNSDHLNSKGRSILGYLLLQSLIEDRYLARDLDKYDYGPLWIYPGEPGYEEIK
jgi:hypothetical protein